ncbi:Serrate RNA effector molecule [Dichanthelium oligosanthes]|uniref:Serrate RNA effector molecule n=1 Tax=Dichanthelium oligosanthes TaxID=888268 RepID=A0A1E5WBB2_9POAL|nr:Serrate RNA effector molecule [Dichanthelium oligosanthes]
MEYVLCSPEGSPPPLGSSRPERLADRLEALAARGRRRCYRRKRRSASHGAGGGGRATPPLPPPPPLGSSRPELALVRLDGDDDDARHAAAAGSKRRSASPGAVAGAGGGQQRRRRWRSPTRSPSPSPAPPKRSRRGSSWNKRKRSEGGGSRACSRSRSPDRPHSGYGATTNGQDNTERLGLMTYKQFTQVLEDDVSPAQAGCRYQEYRTEYITTQKRAYFDLNKNEDWLKDMYHPTKLLSVIERRNDFCKTVAKNLILDLQNGTLDLGPGVTVDAVIKSRDGNDRSSEDGADYGEKKRKHGRGPWKEIEPLSVSAAPIAHPVSSQYQRILTDIDRTLALVERLDLEKDIVGNILTGDHDKSNVDKSYVISMGPLVIVRGLNTVKGLEGVELLDTLLTYLWRVHGVDYYGMSEMKYAKGFRHVRAENKSGGMTENINAADWEKKLDSFWEQRLINGEDPLVVLTAKDKIDEAIVEVLEPYVRKMWYDKCVWKYGCGAKGCEKIFHAPEYVHKHLRLKHPDLVSTLAERIENDIYFQNYMNDPHAPGGNQLCSKQYLLTSLLVILLSHLEDRMRRRPDEQMFGASGGRASDAPLLSNPKCAPLLVLIPVPGAGPYGPFVPAPPEIATQMTQNGLPGPDAAQHRKPSMMGPMLPMYPSFPLGSRNYRRYEDLDAPKEEITALDSRRL